MKPVNLIATGDRSRRPGRETRTGALANITIGALVLVLAAVSALTLFGNQVSDREAEVESLRAEQAVIQARAEGLSSFISFEQTKAARQQTIVSLARSRFDWERVMRELSRVLPTKVWLVSLTGSVSPAAGGGSASRAEIAGPALELQGCARSQREIAKLIAALEDIDGVTRVLATRGEKGADGAATTAADGETCQTRSFVSSFEAIAAFDGVVAGTGAEAGSAAPVEPPPPGTNELDPTAASSPDGSSAAAADGSGAEPAAGGSGGGAAAGATPTSAGGSNAGQ